MAKRAKRMSSKSRARTPVVKKRGSRIGREEDARNVVFTISPEVSERFASGKISAADARKVKYGRISAADVLKLAAKGNRFALVAGTRKAKAKYGRISAADVLKLAAKDVGKLAKYFTEKGNRRTLTKAKSSPKSASDMLMMNAFGGYVLVSAKPSPALVRESVAQSAEALERIGRKLMNPGMKIEAFDDVPLYSLDPGDPGVVIRKLNGKTERGQIVGGAFRALHSGVA